MGAAGSGPWVAWFRRLLRAYPVAFRREYGEEMTRVLADQLRGRSRSVQALQFARAVADLARTAPAERWEAAREPAPALAGFTPAPVSARPVVARGPTRRAFLARSLQWAGAGVATAFGASSVAYLWPDLRGGFGARVDVGNAAALADALRAGGGAVAVPGARAYLVAFAAADDPDGVYTELAGGSGMLAISHRCAHLGCRVPWCQPSSRFECPCHKSRYNRWGEFVSGPAPRGLDRYPVTVADGRVLVDTGAPVTGPARAHHVLDEGPSGPSCLGSA